MILSAMPARFVAGNTLRVTTEFSDYPATSWTVTYYFENGSKKYSAAAAASGTAHALSVDATTTGGWQPGRYRWFARAVSGSIKEIVDGAEGWIDIEPDVASVSVNDRRSWARRALDAVEATIEGKATTAQLSFSMKDRSVSSFTLPELWQLKRDLEAQVRTEEAGAKAGLGRYIKARLTRGR